MTTRIFFLTIAITVAAGQSAIESISPESLRAKLTYLASDELEGRATPSRGLDLAADYIAEQFHREGLEPAAPDGSYFQAAKFAQVASNFEGFTLILKSGGKELTVSADEVLARSLSGLDLKNAPVLRLPSSGPFPAIAGRVVAAEERYSTAFSVERLRARNPALILLSGPAGNRRDASRPWLQEVEEHHTPVIYVHRADAAALLLAGHDLTVTLHLSPPAVKELTLRNVAAILPGSDPALRSQYLVLSAHYDHLGKSPKGIFNGANDNGSGTVSVIEIAGALAHPAPHPRRSILFITFFGEEEGLLGSTCYVRHPLVPLKDTIANINLEQLGRTDESTGKEVDAFAMSGPSYSNLSSLIATAAATEGVRVWKKPDADAFFNRSDNYAFAQQGVVDTTVIVAFDYPDYHAIGDTVDKIDFPNMAKVDRGIAAAILRLADDPGVPKWSDSPAARRYKHPPEN